MTTDHAVRLAATRDFFGARAATWDDRFPEDGPAFAAAVSELCLEPGQVVVDAGAGTGRAIPALREAVGPTGCVVAVDVTTEMLAAAVAHDRSREASMLLADAMHLPLATAAVDAVLAAGLISHLSDPDAGVQELARVTRPGGRLAVFHPIGRATLARRHRRDLSADDLLQPLNLSAMLDAAGWIVDRIDDARDRYLALASRR